ncbi:metallophosphoesterase [Dysgonomonas termitidis]|uniref:Metallophosphoesterase n=1 Tax=Dysgonomonas termitidis TaxID=1516126 RepID=A0ABV9KW18_9BACT
MKVQFASDLHLEFEENSLFIKDFPLIPCGDILLLAGDIGYIGHGTYKEHPFWDWASENFNQVLVVPGNHEFYGGYDTIRLKNGMKEEIRDNIHWYYNKCEVINGVEFLLTPLWSFIPVSAEDNVTSHMPDFKFINYNGKGLTADIYNKMHEQCISFLKYALHEDKKGIRVVVSHHLPSVKCMAEEFKGSALSNAFYTDLDSLIKMNIPEYWIFGHSHRNIRDIRIGQTRLYSNQLGYVNLKENLSFDRSMSIVL